MLFQDTVNVTVAEFFFEFVRNLFNFFFRGLTLVGSFKIFLFSSNALFILP